MRTCGIPANSAPGTSYQAVAEEVRQHTQMAPTHATGGRAPSPGDKRKCKLAERYLYLLLFTYFGVVRHINLLQFLFALYSLDPLLLNIPVSGLPHIIILY